MARGRHRATVTTWSDIENGTVHPVFSPDDYDSRILAEGDSWFTMGGIPTSNLLFSMRFYKSTLICNCGSPGDTIKNMSDIANNTRLRKAISTSTNDIPWDLLLLSGGGNDLIDQAKDILIDWNAHARPADVADYCDDSKLQDLLNDIEAGYRAIAKKRDEDGSICKNKPIVTHTYDYPTPRNAPAKFLLIPMYGPWLFTAFTRRGIPCEDWLSLTDYLFDALADLISGLAKGQNKIKHFHVVDTRNTLRRAGLNTCGESNDWMNEIHPDYEGYKKLAKEIERTMAEYL